MEIARAAVRVNGFSVDFSCPACGADYARELSAMAATTLKCVACDAKFYVPIEDAVESAKAKELSSAKFVVLAKGKEYLASDVATLQQWLDQDRIARDAYVLDRSTGTWTCVFDIAGLSTAAPAPRSVIQALRDDYYRMLLILDRIVGDVIQRGEEMKALRMLQGSLNRIDEIHKALEAYYIPVVVYLPVLRKFGSARVSRLRQPPPDTRGTLSLMAMFVAAGPHRTAEVAREKLHAAGYHRTHAVANDLTLMEIDAMLDVLDVVIEPGYGRPES